MKKTKQPRTGIFIDVAGKLIEVVDFKKAFQNTQEAITWHESHVKTNAKIRYPKMLKHWKMVFIALEKLGIQNHYTLNYI